MAKALVLGAYGLIGAACAAALKQSGFDVTGLGRSQASARRVRLGIDWHFAELADVSVRDWRKYLDRIDVVVNAAGALQNGSRDNLEAVHVQTIARLCEAAGDRSLRLVQISAAGVSASASTEFFRTKARGDAIVQASHLDWVVLRPTLVIGANAYGGTAILRGLAGSPEIGAAVFEDKPVQFIALPELAEAVVACASGHMPMRRVYDLTEAGTRGFGEAVTLIRHWLGLPPHKFKVPVPAYTMRMIAAAADCLGWLGWRSPVRTTAIRTIEDGITGNAAAWKKAGGCDFSTLPQILEILPATLQERFFARQYCLLPVAIGLQSVFWLVSGIVGLAMFDEAAEMMTMRGFAGASAQWTVAAGSIADILLGLAILYRPWSRRACLGMIILAFGYMVGGTVFAFDLWLDPLGPMAKILPCIGLALITYMMLDER